MQGDAIWWESWIISILETTVFQQGAMRQIEPKIYITNWTASYATKQDSFQYNQ